MSCSRTETGPLLLLSTCSVCVQCVHIDLFWLKGRIGPPARTVLYEAVCASLLTRIMSVVAATPPGRILVADGAAACGLVLLFWVWCDMQL